MGRRDDRKAKSECCAAGPVSKKAFYLGAIDRMLRSTLLNTVCATLGFVLGIGSAVVTIHLQYRSALKSDALGSLEALIGQRREMDQKIEECLMEAVRGGLKGKDGIIVWDGKKFTVEKPDASKR